MTYYETRTAESFSSHIFDTHSVRSAASMHAARDYLTNGVLRPNSILVEVREVTNETETTWAKVNVTLGIKTEMEKAKPPGLARAKACDACDSFDSEAGVCTKFQWNVNPYATCEEFHAAE